MGVLNTECEHTSSVGLGVNSDPRLLRENLIAFQILLQK